MNDRLIEFLKNEQLSASEFADIMEIQPSSVSHLTSGRNKPSFDFITKLIDKFPRLNPDWILNGKGEMYRLNYDNVKDDNTAPPKKIHFDEKRKTIEKIIIFFNDKTFEVYQP